MALNPLDDCHGFGYCGATLIRGARTIELHRNEQYPGVAVGYTLPAPELRAYISSYSITVVEPEAGIVFDQLYPEWPNVRFSADGAMTAGPSHADLTDCNPSCGIGPTSRSTHFSLAPGRYWTVSLLPAGWARFVDIPAEEFADRWELNGPESVFSRLSQLHYLAMEAADDDTATRLFDEHLLAQPDVNRRDEERIMRAHAALLDPSVNTVTALADQTGMTIRSLERLSKTAFGFPPKLLLRRQRFLRSLSHFMLDPSLAWLATLDTQYVDQAHFIRDFKRFMGNTPRKYAAQPHPVLWAAAHARATTAGTAMQVLQAPERVGD